MNSSLGYLRIESADPAAWREFGVKVLGMTEGRGPEEGAVYLRMDDFPARLVIVPGSADGCSPLAGRSRTRRRWPRWAERWRTPGSRSRRGLPTSSPRGGWRRCCAWRTRPGTPSRCSAGPRSSTGRRSARTGTGSSPVPWGWVTWCCRSRPDSSAAFDFYTEVLGFRLRDSMRMPAEFFGGGGRPAGVVPVLGCNPRHHSLALAPLPAAAGLVHLMIEAASLDDVGRALDRCARRGAQCPPRWGGTPTT